MNPLGSNQGAIPFLSTYRVSILTNSDIRYEGTLYQVNPDKKNIVLTNVISFGTEGRSRTNEIMGSNVVHDSIVFEGKDIKDLNVIENNPPPPATATNNNNNNEAQNKEPSAPSNQAQDNHNLEDNNNKQVVQNAEETTKQERKSSAVEEKEEKKNESVFDFQEMNEKFHKLTLLESKNAEKGFGKYERTSFFDNISNSTTEKNKETREDRQHQNQIDKETFGSDLMQMRKGQKYKGNNYNTYGKPYYGKPQTYNRTNNYSSHGYRNYDDNNYSYGYRNYEDSNYRNYNNEYNARGGYGRGGAKGGYNNQGGYGSQAKYSKVYEEKKTKEGD